MKIGITGGDSFIGRTLTARMRKEGVSYELFEGDVTHPEHICRFVEWCDLIFHLAGRNRGPDIEVFRVNAVGAANVASAACALGDRHIVFPSSIHVESNNDSAYAKGKLDAEQALLRIAGDRGCKTTILRLPNVYGPGALPFYVSVVATFCFLKACGQADEFPIHENGSQEVELVSADKVTDCLLAAIGQQSSAETIRLEGDTISILELAEIVRDDTRLKGYPAIGDIVRMFAEEPTGITVQDGNSIDLRSFTDNGLRPGSLSLLRITDDYSRPVGQTPSRKDWVMPIEGRLIVDLYAEDDCYINSRLLDSTRSMGIGIDDKYRYVVRSIGKESLAGILRLE